MELVPWVPARAPVAASGIAPAARGPATDGAATAQAVAACPGAVAEVERGAAAEVAVDGAPDTEDMDMEGAILTEPLIRPTIRMRLMTPPASERGWKPW